MVNYIRLNNAEALDVFSQCPGVTFNHYGVEVSSPVGFQVGLPSAFSAVLDIQTLGTGRNAKKDDYADAMRQLCKAVELLNTVSGSEDYYIGAWLDSKGLLYLDISQYVETREEAERLTIARGEQELWSWAEEIAYNPR